MSELRFIPVAVTLGPEANKAAEAAATEARMAQWEVEQAARCSIFLATGRHNYVPDEGPTFFCGSDPWAGYVLHCTGTRTWASSFGQHTERCVMFRFPGDRRGSRGRKNVASPAVPA